MQKKLSNFFKNKSILVTGGTGSFGQKCVETLLKFSIKKVVIFSRDELKQYEMQKKISDKRVRFFLGDVRDRDRLNLALDNINFIIHAAALKQVPKAEIDPSEFIKTNIYGTENVIYASINNDVEKVMLVSTDKAVNPINLYGSTKLCAEKLISASNNIIGSKNIKFSISRYGNVLNSRGSLIPLLKEKIKRNENFELTHKDMTRFFITLQQGVDFVLTNFLRMQGGEIFVPVMKSYKINELMNKLIKGKNLKIKNIGLRNGEKINETLISYDESINVIKYKSFYLIKPALDVFKKIDYSKNLLKERGTHVKSRFVYDSSKTSFFDLDVL